MASAYIYTQTTELIKSSNESVHYTLSKLTILTKFTITSEITLIMQTHDFRGTKNNQKNQ